MDGGREGKVRWRKDAIKKSRLFATWVVSQCPSVALVTVKVDNDLILVSCHQPVDMVTNFAPSLNHRARLEI